MSDSGSTWMAVMPEADLPEARLTKAVAGGVALVLYRSGERIFALANACSHVGGPLHQGRVAGEGDQATLTCPWHGSRFRLGDGAVVRGPATRPQAAYDVRVGGGVVEVRLRS